MDYRKNFLWALRLCIGRQWVPNLDCIAKNREKTKSGPKSVNFVCFIESKWGEIYDTFMILNVPCDKESHHITWQIKISSIWNEKLLIV